MKYVCTIHDFTYEHEAESQANVYRDLGYVVEVMLNLASKMFDVEIYKKA